MSDNKVIAASVKVDVDAAQKNVLKLKGTVEDLKKEFKAAAAGSDEQLAALKKLQAAEQDLTKAQKELKDASGGTFKNFKQQLKEANLELQAVINKFGELSPEAAAAAKKVAELKDTIGDAKALTDAFNPDRKFQAFSTALSGVAGGFSAIQGAMALVGEEGEDVQKTLLKVQSALAVSQGVNSVLELKDSFKQLGAFIQSTTAFQKLNTAATAAAAVVQRLFGISVDETAVSFKVLRGAIIATGLGLLIVALGEVVAHLDDINRAINGVSKQQQALNDINEKAIDGYVSEVTHVRQLQKEIQNENTTKERKKNIIAELNQISPTYFGNIKNETDLQQKLNEQVSKYVEAVQLKARVQAGEQFLQEGEKKKIEEQIQLQKDLAFARSNSGNESAFKKQSEILTGLMQKRVKAIDEELKPINNIIDEANKKLNGLGGDPDGKDLKLTEERNKKLLDLEKIRLQSVIDTNQSIIADTNRTEQERFDAIARAENAQLDLSKVNQKQQLNNASLAEEDIQVIEETSSAERIKIRKSYYDQRKGLADQYFQQQKAGEQELLKSSQEIQLLQINDEREAAKQKVKNDANAEAKRIDDLNVTADQRLQLLIQLREKERLQLDQIDKDYDEKKKAEDEERLQSGIDRNIAAMKAFADAKKKDAEEQMAIEQAVFDNRVALANATEGVLSGLSDLFGKQTAAGKVAALAQIAVNTALGFVQGLDIAQKSAKAAGPGAAFAFPIFYATQIAAVLAAAAKAKSALSSASTGGSATATSSAPTAMPQAPLAPVPQTVNTTIDQDSINGIGNVAAGGVNAVRAYVVEQDSAAAAARAARLQGAAKLGG